MSKQVNLASSVFSGSSDAALLPLAVSTWSSAGNATHIEVCKLLWTEYFNETPGVLG